MKTKEALEKIKLVHGDKYKISDSWEYKNAKSDITLYCPEHGEFHKDFYRLVNMKQGCPVCSHGGKIYRKQGYWNIKEHCIEEAKKYRNKFELQRKCSRCYCSSLEHGWLDEIADLYYDDSIHYMGYDEPINCIYIWSWFIYRIRVSLYIINIKLKH